MLSALEQLAKQVAESDGIAVAGSSEIISLPGLNFELGQQQDTHEATQALLAAIRDELKQ